MRLFRTLCATLGTLFIVSTPSLGAYAAAIPPLSETSVLATDVHLTDAASALSVENKGSATVAAPLRAAAEEASSTPSLWLLTALIISIIILVLVVVFIVYALRSQKAKKKSQAQRVPPSSQGSVPFPVRPGMPEASAYTGGPAQFGQGATYNPYPAQDATPGGPTPRETGFVWQRQTGPACSSAAHPRSHSWRHPRSASRRSYEHVPLRSARPQPCSARERTATAPDGRCRGGRRHRFHVG